MDDTKDKKNIKKEEKTEKKSVDIRDVKKETETGKDDKDNNKTEIKKNEGLNDGLEELPEDIQKILEKKKAEKVSKAKKSKAKVKKKKKKDKKQVTIGKAFIKSTYNNTIVTLTDLNGNVISWASAGIAGFRGPKKSTPYAAQIITRIAVGKAKDLGLSEVSVFVKGIGTGRESAVRALNANGLIVTSIKDVTPIPHNGCRKRKPRRV